MILIKNEESGFTLIEVIVAVLILAVGLTSAAVMQTRAVDGANSANRMSERVTVAEQWIEDLMCWPIRSEGDLDPAALFTDPNMNDGTWQDAPDPDSSIPVRTQFRAMAGYPLESLTTIEATVIPSNASAWREEKKRITFSYIRSARWN
jgi:prepilin-type N-terminal cleavage/methylation domain-containing protein